jgi:cleavage and polyadenylation specificity factor subunit 2
LSPHAQATQGFSAYDLDDVDAAYAAITKLKYSQTAALPGPRAAALAAELGGASGGGEAGGGGGGGAVSVTPRAAGHLLGGCVWVVAVGGEEVVYAPDTNHRKER